MSTIDEILANMSEDDATVTVDELLVIDPNTRQVDVPGSELVFGVEHDTHSERKYFLCPRFVGNELDLASCFFRVNYRNGNGDTDAYLVDDVTIVGDNLLFSWLLSKKVTTYRGQVGFVVCASRPGGNGAAPVEWHTTMTRGTVLEGLEPYVDGIVDETDDAVASLLATVDAQRENVIKEGATQVSVVQAAARAAENASVDEIEAKGTNTLASIPDDYTALGEAVSAIERGTAPGIVCEVEGSSVFVTDSSNKPVQNIRIFGKSTQDGVPSPDAPVEIVSVENPVVTVCGKNLLKQTSKTLTTHGVTFTVNADGSITANGTSTDTVIYPINANFYGVKKGERYTISGNPKKTTDFMLYFDQKDAANNKFAGALDYGEGGTIEIAKNCAYLWVGIWSKAGVTFDNLTFFPMLRVASNTDDGYEQYQEQVVRTTHTLPGIPVTSGGNYTDSDGQQWICDEVDLERGVYVQRVAHRPILSSDNWAELSAEGRYWLIEDAFYNVNASAYCTHFARATSWLNHTLDDGSFIVHRDPSWKDGRLSFKTNPITSLAAWKQFLDDNSVYVVYELATPVETPLSETELAAWRTLHTNKPNTTVLNDAGAHMAVAYIADTKLYIDNKIAALVSGK